MKAAELILAFESLHPLVKAVIDDRRLDTLRQTPEQLEFYICMQAGELFSTEGGQLGNKTLPSSAV